MALAFFIPKGKITLLQGDPGDGKSTFMLTLAAYMIRFGYQAGAFSQILQ